MSQSNLTAYITPNGEIIRTLPIMIKYNAETGKVYAVDENNGRIYTFTELEDLANKGDPAAQCAMGDNCNSEYVNDFSKAFEWYKKSAEKNYGRALWNIATFYTVGVERPGFTVTKNLDEAIKYYEKSAEQGYLESMLTLGQIYTSFTDDYAKAVHWLEKADKLGHLEAYKHLETAKMLQMGKDLGIPGV